MADLNPEEVQKLVEALERLGTQTKTYGAVLKDEALQIYKSRLKSRGITQNNEKTQIAYNKAIVAASENIREAKDAIDEMTRAMTKLTRSIYSGEQGIKKYADAADAVATALAGLAIFLTKNPFFRAMAAFGTIAVKFFKSSADMGDALFKNYQEISRFGAATGDGVKGVYGLMQSFRLSTDQLNQLTQIISENAQGLALFKGTVFGGAQGLADLRKSATATGLELEAFGLGMTNQELNETIAGFISQQAQLGTMDVRTTEAATKSLRAYIMETDLITKLTGASRKQQEDAMRSAQAIEQFRLKIFQLEQEGTPEALAEAQRLSATFKFLNAQSPGLAKAFAQFTTGVIGPEGVGAMIAGQSAIFEVANARGMSFAEGLDRMNKGVRAGLGPGGAVQALAMVGQLGSTLGVNIDELIRFGKISDDVREKLERATSEQERQTILEEAVTKNMVKTMQSDLNSMQAMQNFVELGVQPATAAMATFASVVESVTSLLPKSGAGAVGAGAAAAGGLTAAMIGAKKGMMAGGRAGMLGGVKGAVIGGLGGAVVGGLGGFLGVKAFSGGGAINPDDVLEFRGGITGNRENFDKLDAGFRDRLLAMAYEYKELTRNKLPFGSGQRDQEQNTQVGGAQTSLHIQGRAADLSAGAVNDLKARGLLDKHGFRQNPRSAWHISDTGYQMGGIATGPRSGYSATLHGTEAVVPLPDGRTIPVEMPNLDRSMEQQVSMLGAQLVALQDIVRYMRENTSISAKILQAANN